MKDSDVGYVLPDLYLGDSDCVVHNLIEMDDFIITEDPLNPTDENLWAVMITKGDYKNWVVRYPKVSLIDGELEFTYEVLYIPPEYENKEFVDVELANYFSSVLTEVIDTLHKTEGQVYVDRKTGEQIDV